MRASPAGQGACPTRKLLAVSCQPSALLSLKGAKSVGWQTTENDGLPHAGGIACPTGYARMALAVEGVSMRLFKGLVVGFLIVAGAVCAQDLTEIRTRAEEGNAVAQFMLGGAYLRGYGVPADTEEAVRWLRLAADQGYPPAQFSLGDVYAMGLVGPADNAEAMKWYRLAAEQGHPGAQFNLGVMYELGEGTPQDYVQSYMWIRLAAAGGEEGADRYLEVLEEEMTPAQIGEAERLAMAWRPHRPEAGQGEADR